MVKRCVAFGCSNTSKLGFSLHEFGKSPRRRRQWERFVQRRRANWAVGASSYLCSQLVSFLRVIQSCTVCKSINTWCCQPLIGNTPAGNILMSAAILFAGAIPRQALHAFRHLKCQCVLARTFFRHQQINLQLAIQHVWLRKQEHLLQTAEDPLILGGDGRADSPGHFAKYGSYTMMDLRTNSILTIHLVQSNEVNGSNNMEKEGLIRNITELWARNLKINTIVSDRHLQVAKWIRENMPGTQHLYDVWHIAKRNRKKFNAVAREKDCAVIGLWVKSIVNHMYWSATSTREGQGDLIAAKWSSIENHVHNHHAGHGELFPQCKHGHLGRRQWLQPNTKASAKLSSVISKPNLLRDVKKLSSKYQTSTLEAFHSLVNHFAPKWASFTYWGMLTRLYLAILHHNENSGRPQLVNKDGEKVYKIRFKKFKTAATIQYVIQDCTFEYVKDLMDETVRICENGEEAPLGETPPTLASNFDRPDKAEAIARFGINN